MLCACGCGEQREEFDKYGRVRKFIAGHQHKNKPAHNIIPIEIQNEIIKLYLSGKSTTETGINFKISHSTVRNILIKNNINLRTQSETMCGKYTGRPPWNVGLKCPQISKSLIGKIPWNKGIPRTDEEKKKISSNHADVSGENNPNYGNSLFGEDNPNWKGGITPLNAKLRYSDKYNQWRLFVFNRDNFTCQECGAQKLWLEAHHIKRFSDIMKEYNITTFESAMDCFGLWDLNNGMTYCKSCHELLRKKGGLL